MDTTKIVNDNISRSRQAKAEDNIAEEAATPTKEDSSSPTTVVKKKRYNTVPQTDDHCIVSIIYNTKVLTSQRSGRRTTTSQSVVNLSSNRSLIKGNSSARLAPQTMTTALAPVKAAALALVDKESLNCAFCTNDAQYVCSSLIMSQGCNGDDHAVLNVSERLICSCNELQCISEAKKMRNQEKAQGSGFSVALRCALEPISHVFSTVRREPEMCQSISSEAIGNKVSFDNEQPLTEKVFDSEPPTKKLRFDCIKV